MRWRHKVAELLRGPTSYENTASGIASTVGLPFTQLAFALEERGDTARMLAYLERAAKLSSNPAVGAALEQLRRQAGTRDTRPPPRN